MPARYGQSLMAHRECMGCLSIDIQALDVLTHFSSSLQLSALAYDELPERKEAR
jgi:hypothetical protein